MPESELLALARASKDAQIGERKSNKRGKRSDTRSRKELGTILVVEDDASLRRLTQVQLDKLGYKTRVAADRARRPGDSAP